MAEVDESSIPTWIPPWVYLKLLTNLYWKRTEQYITLAKSFPTGSNNVCVSFGSMAGVLTSSGTAKTTSPVAESGDSWVPGRSKVVVSLFWVELWLQKSGEDARQANVPFWDSISSTNLVSMPMLTRFSWERSNTLWSANTACKTWTKLREHLASNPK